MIRTLLSAAVIALIAPVATAQVFVIGSGLAAECYEGAKTGRYASTIVEQSCTRALHEEAMTRPNRAATLVNRGIIRMRDGRYDAALSDYERAERIDDSQGAIYLNKGAALIYKKQFADAIAPLDRAISMETQDLYAAFYNRAIAKENTGDVPGAYYDFEKAVELNPEFETAKRQLSRFTVSQQ